MRKTFFKIVIHKETNIPSLHGLCAGYENGEWRKNQMVDYLFEYLPEFALNHTEYSHIDGGNVVRKLRTAANNIYKTKKYENRGEFGELLLHTILKEIYNTIPAVSKMYYKDSANDTVKGFDAVHIVTTEESLELWLGEVKFYNNINNAINDVVKELIEHSKVDYLRSEFIAITNKIDNSWPHAEQLKLLLDPNTSLDEVFACVNVPVLLTYDSDIIANHKSFSDDYTSEISSELEKHHAKFSSKINNIPFIVHLFLLPLNKKEDLVKCLDNQLRVWQQI